MSNQTNTPTKHTNGNVASGLIILFIGTLLLVRQMGIFFMPHWLFQWPSILIIVGLFVGAKSNYRDVTWLVIFVVGVVFMIGRALPGFHVSHFMWPMAMIGIGLLFIMRRENGWKNQPVNPSSDGGQNGEGNLNPNYDTSSSGSSASFAYAGEDYLDSTIVFNNLKRTILSKDFKGGVITNVFGNVQLNFLQADINGQAIIDLTIVFSKTTVIVPADWTVVYDAHSVFANVDDKRVKNISLADVRKTLILKGSSVFSQVELVSL